MSLALDLIVSGNFLDVYIPDYYLDPEAHPYYQIRFQAAEAPNVAQLRLGNTLEQLDQRGRHLSAPWNRVCLEYIWSHLV